MRLYCDIDTPGVTVTSRMLMVKGKAVNECCPHLCCSTLTAHDCPHLEGARPHTQQGELQMCPSSTGASQLLGGPVQKWHGEEGPRVVFHQVYPISAVI